MASERFFNPLFGHVIEGGRAMNITDFSGRDLEMAWHLFCWGDEVEVLEPARLAEMVNGNRRAWPALP
jgi:hypothetical protein